MAAKHTLAEGYNPKKRANWWAKNSPANRYITAIRTGMTKRMAAQAAGVTDHAVIKWRNRLDTIDQTAAKLKVSDRMIVRFFQSVDAAEIELAQDLIAGWTNAAKDDWRAAQAFLARRFPDDLGDPKSRVELTGRDGGPIAVDGGLGELVAAARARAVSEAADS